MDYLFKDKTYNPDVLSCLANLSSDEVFTPPALANEVLDMLPDSLWSDKNARFLDPCSKSGVFLREIAKRLLEGLKPQFPDLQARINHIFKNQIFGIAITAITAHLTRRTVYCSKHANGVYSVCEAFDDDGGNIVFEPVEHVWKNGKCAFCGASRENYARGEGLESHAYGFIHGSTDERGWTQIGRILEMKFDVIVGNPPYQMSDGGDIREDTRQRGGAIPIYHKFVQQAKKMNPRYLTMIVPSRWFAGGRGLDDFRDEMLTDRRIRKIVDYPVSSECFPGVEIKGGVCYFLWDRDNQGDCEVTTIRGKDVSTMSRPLLEMSSDIFIRYNESITVFRKVSEKHEPTFADLVSSQKPFGLRTFITGKKELFNGAIKLYANSSVGYIDKSDIAQNKDWTASHKVYITMAYGAGEDFPHQILNKPFYGEPDSCCTETYLVIGPFSTKEECINVISYIKTRFFRFLVLLRKNTQHAAKGVYSFVPLQDFSESWTDEKLYAKYGLTQEETAFIESMVRPMEATE